ncbi:MAG: DUF1761 domain-containing protein [Pseudomonadota bacterium]
MVYPDPIATLIGAVVPFFFGAIYYTVLSKPWLRAVGMKAEDASMTPVLIGLTAAHLLVISFGIGWLLATMGIVNSIPSAVAVLAILWATLILAPISMNHRYQDRGLDLTLIDGIYWLLVVQIAGLAHVLWAGAPKIG